MIIVHRGEPKLAPENSLSAINKAWANGAKAVEIDIHLTSDNEIVVIHDRHTGRTGNKKYYISRSSLKKIKNVDIGIKNFSGFSGERIPALKEVLCTIPDDCKLIIEIKSNDQIIQPLTELIIKSEISNNQLEFVAFNLKTISNLKSALPWHKMLWLLEMDYFWPKWLVCTNKARIIKALEKNNLDGINVWAGKLLNEQFIDFFKKEGYWVYAWTINDPLQAKKLLGYNIDAITTDRAGWLKQQLQLI